AARVCRRALFPTCGGRESAARRATHDEVCRRTTRDRRHAVRRGLFSLHVRLAREDFARVELRVDIRNAHKPSTSLGSHNVTVRRLEPLTYEQGLKLEN